MAAITVNNLVITYHDKVAVNDLSFEVEQGEIAVVLGRNGAGKTSTIESLEGLRRPTAGSISILNHDPAIEKAPLSRIVGVMLQSGGPYPTLNPLRALQLESTYYEHPRDPNELINRLELGSSMKTPAKRLSGGEYRRLCFALALVGDPQVLFLDEPTAGVDPHGRIAIRELIKELQSAQKTIVLTTHELDEAERIADRLLILDRGKLVASGTPKELVSGAVGLRFRGEAGADLADLEEIVEGNIEEKAPGEYLLATASSPELIAAIAAFFSERGLRLLEIGGADNTLEDLFLSLTRDEPTLESRQ